MSSADIAPSPQSEPVGSADLNDVEVPLPPVNPRPGPFLEPTTRAEYPPLPDDVEESWCHYFLGWPDNSKVWARLRVIARKTGLVGRLPLANPLQVQSHLWRRVLQYPHIWVISDLEVPEVYHNDSRKLLSREDTRTNIVAISATHHTYLNGCRPTEAQYRFLVDLFGEEPVWYKDRHPKWVWEPDSTGRGRLLESGIVCPTCFRQGQDGPENAWFLQQDDLTATRG
ncbi:uncharacterized protein TRAVEDRAFT_46357 [Trametes versicolor FP-101664 SS1]|uniref:uncharacterized protein n=1 Tax=Trametes versicolor (strain FP-101664) TaxID=717944 RepID=UPI00046229DD|nr:uncharacterized protein TRAVEDRAFT_46357 [Trametes versicolor FP-101664 SS1]EIW59043.1 hypothetical protein TRAVEDRAFT_46357 [Trametes versicolor FP-101664 SS1]